MVGTVIGVSSTGTDAFTAVFCIPITNVAAALPFLTNAAALVLVLLVTLRKNFFVRCVTLLEPRQRHTSR